MEAQYRGNWGSSIFHFDTDEPVMITKFGLKPSGGTLRWYEAMHEFRGTYNHRRDQENEKIIGRLNNGVRLKLSFRASGPSQLALSGAFGSLDLRYLFIRKHLQWHFRINPLFKKWASKTTIRMKEQ